MYGLRVGEIRCLCLNDIDWRADILRIHHSKTVHIPFCRSCRR
jgi:hypothetical protein